MSCWCNVKVAESAVCEIIGLSFDADVGAAHAAAGDVVADADPSELW